MLNFLKQLFETQLRSNSALELYITSKNPQNSIDVERYTRDYHTKVNQGYFSV